MINTFKLNQATLGMDKLSLRKVLHCIVAFLGIWLISAGLAQAQDYRLATGDKIKVLVFGEPDLSGEFQIDPSGKVSIPLVGVVDARGSTSRELESRIADILKEGFLKNPKVAVDVLSYRPVYVLGEVNRPGQYSYSEGMTVLSAVALAGGFTYRAKKDEPQITREEGGQKSTQDVGPEATVLPGDIVQIPERFW